MGIPGILKEIGKGDRVALSKLAVEHLEKTRRPLRIAIDAAIWNFQNQAAQGGANPALRTLFYKLVKLLALPIQPVFVYDGKNKPLTKRNKTVTAYSTCLPNEMSKQLIQVFRFPHHTAPGEAEAECALLQRKGIVDAVMSQDIDAVMFGSTMTLRDWSQEGSRGNKTPTHVSVLRSGEVKSRTKLDSEGMMLVALLSGGDYNTDGVAWFGPALACEIAKAGFGAELVDLVRRNNAVGLQEWRDHLQYELETNESGYFRTRHKTLQLPHDFPDRKILSYYTHPTVSSEEELPKLERKWLETWGTDLDITALRIYVAEKFEWLYKSGATKFVRVLAPALLANQLCRGSQSSTVTMSDSIKERREPFATDGMPELRVEIIPADVVGLNIEAEDDPPIDKTSEHDNGEVETEDIHVSNRAVKPRTSPLWDPYAPEKFWLPETIVKLGRPDLVAAWEQKQREIAADPKKFATRNCRKKGKGDLNLGTAISRPINTFFAMSKPVSCDRSQKEAKSDAGELLKVLTNPTAREPPKTPKRRARPNRKASITIDNFFLKPSVTSIIGREKSFAGESEEMLVSYPNSPIAGVQGFREPVAKCAAEPHLTAPQTTSSRKNSRSQSTESQCLDIAIEKTLDMSLSNETITAGSSFQESTFITSSPPERLQDGIPQAPGLMSDRVDGEITNSSQESQLPSVSDIFKSVAFRKSRSVPGAAAHAGEVPRKPLTCFFGANAASQLSKTNPDTSARPAQTTYPLLPDEFGTGLAAQVSAGRKIAISRESLPGTWKELELGEVIKNAGVFSVKGKRPSSISLVDLTEA